MTIISTTDLTPDQKHSIEEFWNREYPEQLKYHFLSDIDNYLSALEKPTHFLLLEDANTIRAWAFTCIRDNETWFVMILDRTIRGHGYGTQLLDKLKEHENKLNGWVIDHPDEKKQNDGNDSALNFYLKNGFAIYPDTRFESNGISAVKIDWTR